MHRWKLNVFVVCFAQLLTLIGFSAYLPFMPYYIMDLGAGSYQEAAKWQALFETGSAMAMMLASPVWGALADRFGRKVMLMRATFFGALLAFGMSLVQTPVQLVIIRTLQGAFCGTVSAAMVMVATQTPDEHLGVALGLMQTTQYIGHAIGPLVGGTLGDTLGYRSVFPVSAAMMAVALVMIALFTHERFEAPQRAIKVASARASGLPLERLREVITRNAMIMLLALGAIRFAMAVESPIISLYVKSMAPDHPRIATLAGMVVSASSISTALAALAIGRLADRVGQKKVLVACALGVAAFQAPQAFATSPIQLIVLRVFQGVFMGGTAPTANALLARTTPSERRGTIFGLSNSIQAGGRALGPMVGAGVANNLGMSNVFLVTASLLAVISGVVGFLVQLPKVAPFGQAAPSPAVSPGLAATGQVAKTKMGG